MNRLLMLSTVLAVGCAAAGTTPAPTPAPQPSAITPTAPAASNPSAASAATEGFVTVEPGVRLAYRIVGAGRDVLVVPWPSASSELDLLAKGRRVLYYNPRGRLGSDSVDASKVTFENELKDLEAVRRHFGLDKMMLLSWSHYGMMTAVYAIRNPQRVSRLVQMTPGGPRRNPYLAEGMAAMARLADAAAKAKLEERKKAGEFANDPAALCRENRKVSLTAFVANPADVAKIELDSCRFANEQEANQNKWWEALFGSMGNWNYQKEARALTVPRLVIHGEKDFIPLDASYAWAADTPNAKLLLVRNAGHFPHVEQPVVFYPAVETFLSGEWPKSAVDIVTTSAAPPAAK